MIGMVDNKQEPFRLRLAICALLLLTASGYFAWTAFAFEESTDLTLSVVLIPTAIGVFLRQVWAKYFVFCFATMWIVGWCVVTPPYIWMHGTDGNVISLIVSLIPSAFMLAVSWNVHRGFQG